MTGPTIGIRIVIANQSSFSDFDKLLFATENIAHKAKAAAIKAMSISIMTIGFKILLIHHSCTVISGISIFIATDFVLLGCNIFPITEWLFGNIKSMSNFSSWVALNNISVSFLSSE